MSESSSSWNYPFYKNARDDLKLPDGRGLEALTLDELRAGRLSSTDLGSSAETLRQQARVAEEAGFGQLAANLRRAAELVSVPDETVLEIYDKLRPGRAGGKELEEIAQRLEREFNAPETATFVRDAIGDRSPLSESPNGQKPDR